MLSIFLMSLISWILHRSHPRCILDVLDSWISLRCYEQETHRCLPEHRLSSSFMSVCKCPYEAMLTFSDVVSLAAPREKPEDEGLVR